MADLSELFSRYPVQRRLVTANNPNILLCDEKISIFDVLRDYCHSNVPGYRYKTRCPFSAEHLEDDGRSFQVYETNTAYCYTHQQRYTPSLLLAYINQWSRLRAANFLLEKAGINQRVSYRDRYAQVMRNMENRVEQTGDVQELAMALREDLGRVPGFADAEYSEAVREEWGRVLRALDRLAEIRTGVEQLQAWYGVARRRLLEAAKLTDVKHGG